MTVLSVAAVRSVLDKVLYTDEEARFVASKGEIPPGAVVIDGVVCKFAFHPKRLEAARPEIRALLAELPEAFHQKHGGGWSFLNGCMAKGEYQWGEQMNVDELVCLGIGVGLAEFCMPRDMWAIMPGGVPYFVVLDGVLE